MKLPKDYMIIVPFTLRIPGRWGCISFKAKEGASLLCWDKEIWESEGMSVFYPFQALSQEVSLGINFQSPYRWLMA